MWSEEKVEQVSKCSLRACFKSIRSLPSLAPCSHLAKQIPIQIEICRATRGVQRVRASEGIKFMRSTCPNNLSLGNKRQFMAALSLTRTR